MKEDLVILTYTFDGNEMICAPREQVKGLCEKCDQYQDEDDSRLDCPWDEEDCIEKFLNALDADLELTYKPVKQG